LSWLVSLRVGAEEVRLPFSSTRTFPKLSMTYLKILYSRLPVFLRYALFPSFLFIFLYIIKEYFQSSITILSPEKYEVIFQDSVTITGVVRPSDCRLFLGDSSEVPLASGYFNFKVPLADSVNHFMLRTMRAGTLSRIEEVTVFRGEEVPGPTDPLLGRGAQKQKPNGNQMDQERDWRNTIPGMIQKSHPSWSKEDCIRLARGDSWKGMHFDMLVYQRNQPDFKKLIKTGKGKATQWCWKKWTPSCFYDFNNDGLVDLFE
jgi:hypothetical protein